MDGHGKAPGFRKRQRLAARQSLSSRKRQLYVAPHLQPATITVCNVYNGSATFGWSAKHIRAGSTRMIPAQQAQLAQHQLREGQTLVVPASDRQLNLVVMRCQDGLVTIGADGPVQTI